MNREINTELVTLGAARTYDWLGQAVQTIATFSNSVRLTTCVGFTWPSKSKEADQSFYPSDRTNVVGQSTEEPTLVVEVGYRESWADLLRDAQGWLTNTSVRLVLLIRIFPPTDRDKANRTFRMHVSPAFNSIISGKDTLTLAFQVALCGNPATTIINEVSDFALFGLTLVLNVSSQWEAGTRQEKGWPHPSLTCPAQSPYLLSLPVVELYHQAPTPAALINVPSVNVDLWHLQKAVARRLFP